MVKQLYMIGNAHLDPVWLWRWQDGYEAARSTFRSALDRMNEYPEFTFTTASICYYEWIEHCEPEMFGEIRKRVKEGRWRIVGGWWIQPDCNIPSGESFARQALAGQSYLKEKFGITARCGYNVDSFGHSGSLPAILRLSGMDRYVYMRPGLHEREYPSWTFRWQSPSGEQVTAFRIPFAYESWADGLKDHVARCANEITDENGLMCFYGVGNHGGGPTKRNIESIRAMDGRDGVKLRFSHPDEFFDNVRGDLPVVTGDLLHHASGCYSAHSGIKRLNRKAENALLTAEKLAYIAVTQGARDRSGELKAAWKKLLFNQFHDILAGTCIREAYDDAEHDLGYAISAADDVSNEALQFLSRKIDIPHIEDARAFVVFNPHARAASWPVTIDMEDVKGSYDLIDPNGRSVPWQKQTASAAVCGRMKLCFVAEADVLGLVRYMLVPTENTKAENNGPRHFAGADEILENGFIKATISGQTGEICSLILKSTGQELLAGDCSLKSFRDDSDTWSHGKFSFDGTPDEVRLTGMSCVSEGPVEQTVKVTQRVGDSTVTRSYTVYKQLPYVFTHVKIDWRETQKCLKIAYPLNQDSCRVRAQGAYGHAERQADGKEYPMHGWVDVSGATEEQGRIPFGLAVLNDGKYSYDVHDNTLFVTALRSPYYANHTPKLVDPQTEDYPVTDRGEQEFELVLVPHGALRDTACLDEAAMLLNAPPIIQSEYAHEGEFGSGYGFARIEGGSAVLDALKPAEDGSRDMIVHLHEASGRDCVCALNLIQTDKQIRLSFTPGQIRAVRINCQTGICRAVDLLERDLSRMP